MSLSYYLYLDTPVAAGELRDFLVRERGFTLSESWRTTDGTPWLVSDRGVVLVDVPDPYDSGPHDYPQPKTLIVDLNENKQPSALEYLLGIAGDILQRFPGDAALEYDAGGTVVLRRGETTWVDPDPFVREHLFSGDFRPARLIIGLPPFSPAHGSGVEA